MHTTEQRREIFKSYEKEILFLNEIIGNKNMSEILHPMIKEKFMDSGYDMNILTSKLKEQQKFAESITKKIEYKV